MRKAIFILLTFSLLVFAGCSKDEKINTNTDINENATKKMLFNAGSPLTTKSYFGDANGTLYWSDSDNIGVYSTNSDAGNSLVHSGIATLKSFAGSDAVFESTEDRATWAGSANNLTLYSFYPIASSLPTLSSSNVVLDNVSANQTGEFGLYHIMYADPINIAANDLKSGEDVTFRYKPATSILRVRPYLDAYNIEDEITITQLVITIADNKKIAGQASLNLSNGTITPTGVNESSSITVTLDPPKIVTTNLSTNDYITVALLPIESDNATLDFKAITDDGQTLTLQTKLSPSKFVPGKRYNADVKVLGSYTDFYYYGEANCLLIKSGQASGTLNIAPYVTDQYFTRTDISAPQAPAPVKAEVIWQESAGMIATATISGNTMTVVRQSATTYGNALVGIYDASDNLLWSYHIWCPEDDPTNTLGYTLAITGETFDVMPMALGATKIITHYNASGDEKGNGLYYQWGRKDPLGRGATYNSNTLLTVYDKSGASVNLADPTNVQNVSNYISSNYTGEITDPTSKKYKSIARFVLDFSIANPQKFIASPQIAVTWNWLAQFNNYLWGNGHTGNSFVVMSKTYKSIFDPSPKGYRVAPPQVFTGFTSNGGQQSYSPNWNVVSPDFTTLGGLAFYYAGRKTGPSDFYPASGYRTASAGGLTQVTGSGYVHTSSTGGAQASIFTINSALVFPFHPFDRARGITVRCVKE